MNGYLGPHAHDTELRSLFRTYQCGLCHTLESEYGFRYRTFATTDLVFLNIWLDALAGEEAEIEAKACPFAPVVTNRMPIRKSTSRTKIAAAFGVYMAVEKLADDVADEGELKKRIGLWVFSEGQGKARQTLVDAGFPMEEVDAAMARQRHVERMANCSVDAAAVPTRAISRLLFAHAGGSIVSPTRAADIGDAVGAFLFYMDNLLDFHADLRAGGYNALARAFGVLGATETMPEGVRAAGVAGADSAVAALTRLVRGAIPGAHGRFVEATLVAGFADKLRRFNALDAPALQRAELTSIQPEYSRWQLLWTLARTTIVTTASRVWTRAIPRLATKLMPLRAAFAFLLLYLLPRSAWAQDTAAAAMDTGWQSAPDVLAAGAIAADTGVADTGTTVASGPWEDFLDTCFCPRCCFASIENACTDSCGGACGDSCGEGCGNSCGDGCSNSDCCGGS